MTLVLDYLLKQTKTKAIKEKINEAIKSQHAFKNKISNRKEENICNIQRERCNTFKSVSKGQLNKYKNGQKDKDGQIREEIHTASKQSPCLTLLILRDENLNNIAKIGSGVEKRILITATLEAMKFLKYSQQPLWRAVWLGHEMKTVNVQQQKHDQKYQQHFKRMEY